MNLIALSSGDYEVTLTDVEFRVLHEAVNRMIETANWEFQLLMGVFVEDAIPVQERLDHLAEEMKCENTVFHLSEHEISVCRNSIGNVVGAFGQEMLLAERAKTSLFAVKHFYDEIFHHVKQLEKQTLDKQRIAGSVNVAFLGYLVHEIRELLPILSEHLVDMGGELLPHLLMADLERWAEVEFKTGGSRELLRLLDLLEKAWTQNDPQVTELISVSFLEHLPKDGEQGNGTRKLIGPCLSEQLEVIG